jgi:CheY-like chemotaxis protein
MVIDDDEISLSLISLLLRSEGYEVIEASGGAAALEMLAAFSPESHPGALIVDLHMPGLCGPALAAELHGVAPQAIVLAMSATPDAAEGYDGFLKKPLDLAALRAILNSHAPGAEQPHPATHDDAALDETVYEKMSRMMPPAALREVYEACLNDAYGRVNEMRAAAANNDLSSIRAIAHALKGSAGMLGARKLSSSAAELELRVYQPAQVCAMIDNLLSCCDELHRILVAKLS